MTQTVNNAFHAVDESCNDAAPEQRLFMGVICNAVLEASGRDARGRSKLAGFSVAVVVANVGEIDDFEDATLIE